VADDPFLHITPLRDPWHHPGSRYGVHRSGQRVLGFTSLADAKAWVVEHHGPQKWTRKTVPSGRGTRPEWWPTPKEPGGG
jgi:hypothetical protein